MRYSPLLLPCAVGALLALAGCADKSSRDGEAPAVATAAKAAQADEVAHAAPTAPAAPETRFATLESESLQAMGRGDRKRAIALLEEARLIAPDEKMPHQRLCSLYRALRDPASAIPACEAWRAREQNPAVRASIDKALADLRATPTE